jgi:hypothetical protein
LDHISSLKQEQFGKKRPSTNEVGHSTYLISIKAPAMPNDEESKNADLGSVKTLDKETTHPGNQSPKEHITII